MTKQFTLEIKPLQPFDFKLTVHKKAGWYWLTPFEISDKDTLWTGDRINKKVIGLKLKYRVPKSILNTSFENKMAFLAGAFDGDGCICNFEHTNKFSRPIISIWCISKLFLEDITNILSKNSVSAKMHLRNNLYSIRIRKFEDLAKFTFYMWPHLRLKRKRSRITFFLGQAHCLEILRVKNSEKIRSLIRKCKCKLGGSIELVNFINKSLSKKMGLATINDWLSGRYRPTVKTIIDLCDLLVKDYFEYIPVNYSLALYSQGIINIGRLNLLRKSLINQ